MFTDVVGFTSQVQKDEKGTLARLQEEEELIRPLLEKHHGRTVKSTGDGLLVEFPSALEAIEAAIDVQELLHERNRQPGRPSIELRIGIHLGDVQGRGDDILGDAVNLAARLQPLAEPGGVALSQQVYDQVQNKIGYPLERMGPVNLKGVQFPLGAYRLVFPWVHPSTTAANEGRADRLAVLPFSNISPDPHDAYLADGLTEEIISVLSKLRGLKVIARTSVEAYRNVPRTVHQVGEELSVGWVLEGSVRKAGPRLRITAQLIDARTQEHRWADTYDRQLDDVFALQSEMAEKVAEALKLTLSPAHTGVGARRTPPNPESYREYLKGRARLRSINEEDLRAALVDFQRALELDPTNAAAFAGMAEAHGLLGMNYHHLPMAEWQAETLRSAKRAVELDPDLAEAQVALSVVHLGLDQLGEAERALTKAIGLNPSSAVAHLYYGGLLALLDRPEDALKEYALAGELDPLSSLPLAQEIDLLNLLQRLDEAAEKLERLGSIDHQGILYQDRKAELCYYRGDRKGFEGCFQRFNELLPGRPEARLSKPFLLAWAGERDEARRLLREFEASDEPNPPFQLIARIYALLGDLDDCFRWLTRAGKEHRLYLTFWRYAPDMAAVRADPRYPAIVALIGAPA
jgi:adenylate cyclase